MGISANAVADLKELANDISPDPPREDGKLFLLKGHYGLECGATLVTFNGHPAHFEWDHKPTGKEKQDAMAAARVLIGKKVRIWGNWENRRTGLHYVSVEYDEPRF